MGKPVQLSSPFGSLLKIAYDEGGDSLILFPEDLLLSQFY
jgi:hypothetical protein